MQAGAWIVIMQVRVVFAEHQEGVERHTLGIVIHIAALGEQELKQVVS
jgi:hypothetical protein